MPTRPVFPGRRHRQPDCRPSARARGYDSVWERLRLTVLGEEPLCRQCKKDGRTTAATLVDHITPLEDGGARLDRANLQSLCVPCHAVKTAADVARRRAIALTPSQ